ncbi:MAG: adenylate/guanylate cyclase domain-containing protein [Desulfobacteraceae bacterium]|nr:adenylate/guanylate cyclase domain-containing protein [Desulfobacteraceae bacterium]MBC2754336.1 adenylate/guanylate cyclase domain-containing protein [Desulfobacteraceae bacterium]
MAGQSQNITILFADICKSSQLYEVLGDREAQQVIGKILTRLADITEQYNGKVIKSIGDAVMSIFFSVDNAVDASKSMQESIKQNFSNITGSFPINIHIGFHHGPVIIEDRDIFGDAVNIASRVADYAKPRQIVTTKTTIEEMPERLTPLIRYIAKIAVKNISEDIEAYEIVWDKRETTTIMDHQKLSYKFHTKLDLIIGNQTIVIDNKRPSVTIGRMDYNDIVIDLYWVSRSHISIEYRKGIFMIADKSSNGTYIYPETEDMKFIKKSEYPLSGKGCILLGMDKNSESHNEVIIYSVK